MNHLRGLIAALGFIVVLGLAAPAVAQNRGTPGKFDFYVLTLSWSPSYCEAEGDRRRDNEQCGRGRPFAFVVHGLWPQYERGYPRACVNPAPRIPNRMIDSMLDLMPARGLVIHEWREHGTCSGLSADEYFKAVRSARERIAVPERFRRLDAYETVAPLEVEDAFRAVNPELKADMISVVCDHRWLREVRICMNRDFTFRPCPDVDRRACRTPRIVMPPVRD